MELKKLVKENVKIDDGEMVELEEIMCYEK